MRIVQSSRRWTAALVGVVLTVSPVASSPAFAGTAPAVAFSDAVLITGETQNLTFTGDLTGYTACLFVPGSATAANCNPAPVNDSITWADLRAGVDPGTVTARLFDDTVLAGIAPELPDTSTAYVSTASFTLTPGAPTGAASSDVTTTSASVSWAAGDDKADGYQVYLDGVAIGQTTNLSYDVTGLTPGTGYAITVAALIGTTPGAKSGVAGVVTATGVPAAIAAASITSTGLNLLWSAAPGAVTAYKVYQDGVLLGSVAATARSYLVSGLTADTAYTFTVTAVSGSAEGAAASTTARTLPAGGVITTPSAPTALSTSVLSSSAITVSWSAPASNGGAALTGYTLTRNGTVLASVSGSTTTYTASGLTAGTAYTFTVAATNSAGTGPAATATATTSTPAATLPSAPTALSATATATTIALTWAAPASGGTILAYNIYSGSTLVTSLSGAVTSYTLTGLTAATAYTVGVSAVTAAGEGPKAATAASTTTPAVLPGAPTALSASGTTTTGTTLTWSAPATGTAVSSYTIAVATAGTSPITVGTVTGTTLTYTSTALLPGVAYTFTVTGTNAAGTGAGATVAVTTLAAASAPGPVRTLTAGTATTTSVPLTWLAPASGTVSDYRIYDGTTLLGTVPAGTTAYTVTGLTADTAYTFTVTARNASGESTKTTVTARTAAAAGEFDPTVKTVSAGYYTPGYIGTMTVSWSVVTGAAGYRLTINGTVIEIAKGQVLPYVHTGVLGPKDVVSVSVVTADKRVSKPTALFYVSGGGQNLGTVAFATNASSLSSAAKKQLTKYATSIRAHGFTKVTVSGSPARVKAITTYLKTKLTGVKVTFTKGSAVVKVGTALIAVE